MNLDAVITQYKEALIKKARKKGIWEYFGQKEVRELNDKYPDEWFKPDSPIKEFENWVQNFDLRLLKSATEDMAKRPKKVNTSLNFTKQRFYKFYKKNRLKLRYDKDFAVYYKYAKLIAKLLTDDESVLSGVEEINLADLKRRFKRHVEISLVNKQYDMDFKIPLSILPKKYKTIIKQRTTVAPETASILVKGRYIRHIIISHGRDSKTTNNQISVTVNDIINFIDIIVSCDDISIERKGKTIKFIKYDKCKMILVSVNVKDGNVRMKTYYKIREDKACDVHTDFSAAPQFTSKNVPYCPQVNSKDDTNKNLLQDSLIDNKKRFYDIYEKANGKYADYFLIIENLLGLKLRYHYGDIIKVYEHNTTYHYVYLGFRKNPYNDSLEYYNHNVLSLNNSNTTTYSEKELTLVKKRNQVEELAQISYNEVNELIDKGYLEKSWYYRDGGLSVINSLHRTGSTSFDYALNSFRRALDKKFIDEYNPKWVNGLYLIQKGDLSQAILDYARINYLLNIKKINYEQSIKKVSEYLTNKIQ